MGVRDQGRAERSRRVVDEATRLFLLQGYAATTIPQIAAAAQVSVGTVANTGDKDALFLTAMEQRSTAGMLARIDSAAREDAPLTAQVSRVVEESIDELLGGLDLGRDYLVAWLRTADHRENAARLDRVWVAWRGMWPADASTDPWTRAGTAAMTAYLCLSTVLFGLASREIEPEVGRRMMQAVVTAQCAPFAGTTSPTGGGQA